MQLKLIALCLQATSFSLHRMLSSLSSVLCAAVSPPIPGHQAMLVLQRVLLVPTQRLGDTH